MSSPCLDPQLEIDIEWFRTKLYVIRDDSNFPIVNFSFTCSNIQVASINGVCISRLSEILVVL